MIDKKELRRAAKERVTAKGIWAARCKSTGDAWVANSRDLTASETGLWFMLRNGMHHNKSLQAAWNLHGADAFQFEILETLDDDLPPMLLNDALRDRQKHWIGELHGTAV